MKSLCVSDEHNEVLQDGSETIVGSDPDSHIASYNAMHGKDGEDDMQLIEEVKFLS